VLTIARRAKHGSQQSGLISLIPRDVLGILQDLADVAGVHHGEPGFVIADAVVNPALAPSSAR
jgi:hypothetical protein